MTSLDTSRLPPPQFTYRRGEPITLSLVLWDADDLDPSTLTVSMALKRAMGSAGVPPRSVAAVQEFTITFTAATGTEPARWTGTIPGAVNVNMAAGNYITDAMIMLGDVIIDVSRPAIITLAETVTPP